MCGPARHGKPAQGAGSGKGPEQHGWAESHGNIRTVLQTKVIQERKTPGPVKRSIHQPPLPDIDLDQGFRVRPIRNCDCRSQGAGLQIDNLSDAVHATELSALAKCVWTPPTPAMMCQPYKVADSTGVLFQRITDFGAVGGRAVRIRSSSLPCRPACQPRAEATR